MLNLLMLLALCVVIYLIGLYVLRRLRVDNLYARNRAEIKRELELTGLLYDNELSNVTVYRDSEVVVYAPENRSWNGRAEYVARRVEQLIADKGGCLICGSDCKPVRIAVYPMRWFDGMTIRLHREPRADNYLPGIIFSENVLRKRIRDLDEVIAHECGHLMVCESDDEHGTDWQFYYRTFLGALRGEPLFGAA